jgi:hypothetical protein
MIFHATSLKHRMLNHIKSNQSTNGKLVLTDGWSTFPECPRRIENIPEVRGLAKAEHWHHLSHIFSHLKLEKFNKDNFAQINNYS